MREQKGKLWFLLILLLAFGLNDAAFAKRKKTKRYRSKKSYSRKIANRQTPYRLKFNYATGLHIYSGKSGINMGGQLGYAFDRSGRLFFGPEINFSHLGPESVLSFLGTMWWETNILGNRGLTLAVGGGLGISALSAPFIPTSYDLAVYGEVLIIHQLSRVAAIRGQIRPGWIGSEFSLQTSLNVSFRFRKSFIEQLLS